MHWEIRVLLLPLRGTRHNHILELQNGKLRHLFHYFLVTTARRIVEWCQGLHYLYQMLQLGGRESLGISEGQTSELRALSGTQAERNTAFCQSQIFTFSKV